MKEIVISEIQIIPVRPHEGLVAFASFVLNKQFYIGNVAIYCRLNSEGYRLVYPSKMLPINGKEIQCFHPICKEAAEDIEKAVINKLNELVNMRQVSNENK